MIQLKITVDFNGIILFDLRKVEEFYSGESIKGQNIYRRLISTGEGDEIVKTGTIVPINNINDGIYDVQIRGSHEKSIINEELFFVENKIFPFASSGNSYISDMSQLLEWDAPNNCSPIHILPGMYSIEIRGYKKVENFRVIKYGYDILISPCEELPKLTADISKNMQTMSL